MHEKLYLTQDATVADLERLLSFLHAQGTFHFPALANGLFPAAATGEEDTTGYRYVWVRDNVHIAHAHRVLGKTDVAVRNVRALAAWFGTQRPKMRSIAAGQASHHDVMLRPHIRFHHDMTEVDQKWAHAQNDALGYFLWNVSRLAGTGCFTPDAAERHLLADLVAYLHAIRYWEDADSGHWEEARKVSASSIGAALAGLEGLAAWLAIEPTEEHAELRAQVASLADAGRQALARILPHECIEPHPERGRRYDAALLFLIYPLEVVDDAQADWILADVTRALLGEHGIRRYLGDSYWCADYKLALAAEERTVDFSDDMARRDRMARPGLEAQWCIFDPILSTIYGRRYQRHGRPEDRQRQWLHLNRSLGQLTEQFRGPESYYSEAGRYVPNDIVPLLWTEANLAVALCAARTTLEQTPAN
jgi:hypothetical protein